MNSRARQRPWPRLLVDALGAAPVAIAIYVLFGWYTGSAPFHSPAPNTIPMAPSTALSFAALGGAVLLRGIRPKAGRGTAWIVVVAGVVALAGFGLFVTSSQGIYLEAEHLGLSIEGPSQGIPLGHMSPATATLFMASGLSLLAAALASDARRWLEAVARWLASLVVVAGFVLVLTYLWNVQPLYRAFIIPPAALTSFSFLLLGLSLFGLSTWAQHAAAESGEPRQTMLATYLLAMAAFTAGGIAIGYLTYRGYEDGYRGAIESELTGIGGLKVAELEDWRHERLGDGANLFDNAALVSLTRRLLENRLDESAREEMSQRLATYVEAYEYDSIWLLDPQGVAIWTYPDDNQPPSLRLISEATTAQPSGQVTLVDFYRDEPNGPAHLLLLVPILDARNAGGTLATLALRIDPKVYLYPFIQGWPTDSETAETVLVRREGEQVVFLNDLRFQEGAELNLHLPITRPDLPAAAALQGTTGIVEGLDYRGERVVAYVSPVEDSPWAFVASMDLDEARAPVMERGIETLLLVAVLLAGAAAGLGLLLRQERVEQEHSAAALRQSQDRMQTTMDSMLEGAQIIGYDWRYLYVNEAVALQGKKPKEELLGRTMMEAYPGIDQTDFFVTLRRCMEQRVTARLENEFVFPDGSKGWFELSLQPVPEGVFILSSDITERKRAEAVVQRHAERVEALNRVARIVSSSLDLDEIYDGFVAELRRLLPVDRTSITRVDEAAERWTIVRQWTAVEPSMRPGDWHPLPGSAIGHVVRSAQPLIESPIDADNQWAESSLLRAEGMQSRIIVPLVVNNRATGTVSFAARAARAFSEEDLDLVVPMAAHLALAVENIRLYLAERDHAASLEQRVAERTMELEAANQELEAFSYSVSHDLRAPLRAVDGFSRILQEDHATALDKDARRYLDLVRDSTQRMGRLIDDLLAFSRLGRQELTGRAVQPSALARQALEGLRAEQDGRQVEIEIEDLPEAQADPDLLRQVYANLLSNALKFTRGRQPGRIQVGSCLVDGERAYFVRDNGAGFDMAYAGKLFGVFQRLHRAEEYEGTGVGLAIVQRVIHRHGGRVWAEGSVGRGATFYFTLPEGSEG